MCEVLTTADAVSPLMTGSGADGNLPRRGLVRSSPRREGSRARGRLPRRDRRVTRMMARLIRQRKRRSRCSVRPCLSAPGPAWQQDPRWDCLDQRRWPERADHTSRTLPLAGSRTRHEKSGGNPYRQHVTEPRVTPEDYTEPLKGGFKYHSVHMQIEAELRHRGFSVRRKRQF